jgi:hypothetical protein
MATPIIWYAGRCTKRPEHSSSANIEVLARQSESSWLYLENAKRLFPKDGEIDLHVYDSRPIRVGDLVAFAPESENKRTKKWRSGTYRKLFRFADLSYLGSVDAARQHLLRQPLPSQCDTPGSWMLRVSGEAVVLVDVRRTAAQTLAIHLAHAIPEFPFVDANCIALKLPDLEVVLYDVDSTLKPIREHDWALDAEYALRVIRSVATAGDPIQGKLIERLKAHAETNQQLTLAEPDNLAAARDAARSGELARRLAAERNLLDEYVTALLADRRISQLLDAKLDALAKQESHSIKARLEKAYSTEIEEVRKARLDAVKAEVKEHERTQRKAMAARLAEEEERLLARLADQKQKREQEAERALVAKKAELEAEIQRLTSRKEQLDKDCTAQLTVTQQTAAKLIELCAEEKATAARLAELREEQLEAAGNLQHLATLTEQLKQPRQPGAPQQFGAYVLPQAQRSITAAQLNAAINDCLLLTDTGRSAMRHFAALLLAGEVPILTGTSSGDFLNVAESLLAAGMTARLPADPTIITYDDLWVRAGIGAPTSLAQAATLVAGDSSACVLACIETAERSAARFWFPALADRARRGLLPRKLLLCLTVTDLESDEAKCITTDGVVIDVTNSVAKEAPIIALASLSSNDAQTLQISGPPPTVKAVLDEVGKHYAVLSIDRAKRAARSASELAAMMLPNKATAEIAALVQRFKFA